MLPEDEKNCVKHLTKQFFNQGSYFFEVWKYLSNPQKNKILEIIAELKELYRMKK